VIPKHKGTEKLRGQLKARMAKLKEEIQRRPSLGRAEHAYSIRREGAAQIVLLGVPNCGKSTLFSAITNAHSDIGNYPFTTQNPIPGMMTFENIQIQLIDTPPILQDRTGPGLSNLIRNTDAMLLLVDVTKGPLSQMEVLLEALKEMKVVALGKEPVSSLDIGWVLLRVLLLGNKCDAREGMKGFEDLETHFGRQFSTFPISAK